MIFEYESEIARSKTILAAKKTEQVDAAASLSEMRQTYVKKTKNLQRFFFRVGDQQYTLAQVNRSIDSKQIEKDKFSVEAESLNRKHKELLTNGAERQSVIDQAKIQKNKKITC